MDELAKGLEQLQDERDQLVSQIADLVARHGVIWRGSNSGGTWYAQRDIVRAGIEADICQGHAGLQASEMKRIAEVDPRWRNFISITERERTELVVKDYRLRSINERIRHLVTGSVELNNGED